MYNVQCCESPYILWGFRLLSVERGRLWENWVENSIRVLYFTWTCCRLLIVQVNQLTHVRIPVMLLPDDFKAYTKVKVDNLHFNKYVLTLSIERVEYSLNILYSYWYCTFISVHSVMCSNHFKSVNVDWFVGRCNSSWCDVTWRDVLWGSASSEIVKWII